MHFAQAVKERVGASALTQTVGYIVSSEQAENIVKEGKADLVSLAREFLRDPFFPLRAARELGVDVVYPMQYERAKIKK